VILYWVVGIGVGASCSMFYVLLYSTVGMDVNDGKQAKGGAMSVRLRCHRG
jgi:hypothetical protein